MKDLFRYLVILFVFFAIDILWIGFIAKSYYAKSIGFLMKKNPNWIAAICFYLLYIFGLLFFVVGPAIEKQSMIYAFWVGGLFGLISYSTYDLTNLATIKDWPLKLTIIDLIWGCLLTGTTCLIAYSIINNLL
jgi:uncharacterized membrane protein